MAKNRDMSQFDPGQVMKLAHDDRARALRVFDANSQVPAGFTKVVMESNGAGSVTKARFYGGTSAEKTRIKFVGDVGGSLQSKYFYINSGEDNQEYYVWYNGSGLGVDPQIPGKCGIEIPFVINDPVSIITLSTKLVLGAYEHFYVEPNGNDVLLINCVKMGMTTPTVDVNTGFFITQSTAGATERIKCIELPEETDFIYKFNYAEQKFELIYTGGGTVSVAGSNSPTIQNINAALANTEYSFVIPSGTKKYRFRVRDDGAVLLKYAFVAGQSGTNYMTVYPGSTEIENDMLLAANKTVYFRVSKANQIIELITWS